MSAGEAQQPCSGLEEAVAAAEGSVVALMAPNGSWASGVIASAAHGYIITVAHLLSKRSQPPAQQPAQHSEPVKARPSEGSCSHSRRCGEDLIPHGRAGSDDCISELSRQGVRQHCYFLAHPGPRRAGGVLVQIQAPQSPGQAREGKRFEAASLESMKGKGSRQLLWTTASLVYSFKGPLDIAVLQLDNLALSSSLPDLALRPGGVDVGGQGERVAVLGFPLLSPRLGFGPCATAGIISKVLIADAHAHWDCYVDLAASPFACLNPPHPRLCQMEGHSADLKQRTSGVLDADFESGRKRQLACRRQCWGGVHAHDWSIGASRCDLIASLDKGLFNLLDTAGLCLEPCKCDASKSCMSQLWSVVLVLLAHSPLHRLT